MGLSTSRYHQLIGCLFASQSFKEHITRSSDISEEPGDKLMVSSAQRRDESVVPQILNHL